MRVHDRGWRPALLALAALTLALAGLALPPLAGTARAGVAPGAVTGIVAVEGSPSVVRWNPPTTVGDGVTRYVLRVDDLDPWIYLDASVREYSLGTRVAGPHTVDIRAVSNNDWGPGSRIDLLQGRLPSAPRLSIAGTVAPVLTWTASAAVLIPVTRYIVVVDGEDLVSVAPTVRSTTLRGLDPGPHDITVHALTTFGPGPDSAPMGWVQPDVPSPVTVTGAAGLMTSVRVSWDAPSDNGGRPVLGYRITVRRSDSGAAIRAVDVAATARSGVVAGLPGGVRVLASVAARNAVGLGDAAPAPITVVTGRDTRKRTALTLVPPSAKPAAGLVRFTARLTTSGKPIVGQTVRLGVLRNGTWTAVASARTTAAGTVILATRLTAKTFLQARFGGSASALTSASPVLSVVPKARARR